MCALLPLHVVNSPIQYTVLEGVIVGYLKSSLLLGSLLKGALSNSSP